VSHQSSPEGRPPLVITLRSEFASVSIRHDVDANGDRLELLDLRSGRRAHLDPLVLEALIWSDVSDLSDLLDPGRRWHGDGDEDVDDDH
jgi:hypothetical protein